MFGVLGKYCAYFWVQVCPLTTLTLLPLAYFIGEVLGFRSQPLIVTTRDTGHYSRDPLLFYYTTTTGRMPNLHKGATAFSTWSSGLMGVGVMAFSGTARNNSK